MQPKALLRPEQLQHLLTTLETDYKQLSVAYRNTYRSEEDRASARRTLEGSVSKARDATEGIAGVSDPTLQLLARKLMVQLELADDACKHPETLRR